VDIIYWLIGIALLIALSFAGVIRPTGLLSRTPEEEEKERQREAIARVLKKKDGEDTDRPVRLI
jgi:hypothetical protein